MKTYEGARYDDLLMYLVANIFLYGLTPTVLLKNGETQNHDLQDFNIRRRNIKTS